MKNLKISILATVCSLQLVCKLQNVVFAGSDKETERVDVNGKDDMKLQRAEFELSSIYNFEQFKKVFNRHYKSVVENLSRKRLFINRALRAFKSSLEYKYNKSDHYLKINQMSDWTDQELQSTLIPVGRFIELYGEITNHNSIEKRRYKRGILRDSKIALNKVVKGSQYNFISIDHRDSRCLGPIKDQGSCGSCYIYATISLYEWLYCKATGESIDFSEQYVIDCGHRSGSDGCQGGVVHNVVNFVKNYGLEIDQNYPNTGSQGVCKHGSTKPADSQGFIRPIIKGLYSIDEQEFEKKLKQSPILVALMLNASFFEYGGGVDDAKGCDPSRFHLVLLIGSGREDGKDYWLFRNSHGSIWGWNGHYKLNKNTTCIMMNLGYVIEDWFKSDSLENMNPRYNT